MVRDIGKSFAIMRRNFGWPDSWPTGVAPGESDESFRVAWT
jgi:hypothetical protein